MPATEPTLPTLHDFLAGPLRVGPPDVCGTLAVFPVFGPPPVAEYVACADGVTRGVVVKELAGGASVNDLLVLNPTDVDVLLYEGEEQGAVWDEVAAKSARMDVTSSTGAMHDIYEGRRDGLRAFEGAVSLREGRTGALVALDGRITVLDHVSRPDAFAALHGPLVQG
jgi:hypothetical protein